MNIKKVFRITGKVLLALLLLIILLLLITSTVYHVKLSKVGEGMSPITVLVSCKSPAVAGIVEEANGVWRTGW